jgi:hypothetical protein
MNPAWEGPTRNLGADVKTPEITGNASESTVGRSILDAPAMILVPVCSPPMIRAQASGFAALLLAVAAAACGDSAPPPKDPTTVTIRKPGDPGNAPPPGSSAPANPPPPAG